MHKSSLTHVFFYESLQFKSDHFQIKFEIVADNEIDIFYIVISILQFIKNKLARFVGLKPAQEEINSGPPGPPISW